MSRVSIGLLKSEDFSSFKEYIEKSFHQKYILTDQKFLNWQYGNSIYIAKSGFEIIGHFGFKDILYKVGNDSEKVRVLMNLFVLKPYRLSGLAAMLAKTVMTDPERVFVSGYKDAASKMFKNLRPMWADYGVLKRYFIPLNFESELLKGKLELVSKKKIEYTLPENFKISNEMKIDEGQNQFWQKIRIGFGVTVERTKEYLEWRFLQHPNLKYRILSLRVDEGYSGYLVWRTEQDEGFAIARIIDFVVVNGACGKALLFGFLEEALAENCDAADFIFSGKANEAILKDVGFSDVENIGLADFPILFSPISLKKAIINIGGDLPIENFEDTYFTKADGDQDRPNPQS